MHIKVDLAGNLGANGIVGGGMGTQQVPLYTTNEKTGKIVVRFGDGATNKVLFHGAVNMASIWNLPVIFIVSITVTEFR